MLSDNENLYAERIEICKKCPLCRLDKKYDYYICDSARWMNPETEEIDFIPHGNWIKGCGCIVSLKAREEFNHCVAGKW